ncbi:MAG: class I SAM-dependent methyltransferase [Verrucomicrobiae bacterium]|nr:class I SAM-dependent methyltransferase [Verrucomicrobiae bacterium]
MCGAIANTRTGYGRLFLECGQCGFIWSHDYPEWLAKRGMGLRGSWGGPERGGERDDYIVRLLYHHFPEKRIMLFGVGTTLVFRVLLEEGLDVLGVDVSRAVVQFRREEFGSRFIHTTDLKAVGRKFDIITACEVIEHLHRPRQWFRLLNRCLQDDGVIAGCTNLYPGSGPIEDGQKVGYMSLGGHVAYWSERSLTNAFAQIGLTALFFEIICPGSSKPDLLYQSLFPNKRLFFATRNTKVIEQLRNLQQQSPILPLDTSDYQVPAYRK